MEGSSGNKGDEDDLVNCGAWIVIEGSNVRIGNEDEERISCTQMYLAKGRALTKRGKIIARRWSCWNVYDVHDCNFVCCVRKALGRGISVTKMHCMQFRQGRERKFRHEAACVNLLSQTGTVRVNDSGDIEELGSDDECDSTGGSESESSDSEFCTSEDYMDAPGTVEADDYGSGSNNHGHVSSNGVEWLKKEDGV